jgi:hypothetical protein
VTRTSALLGALTVAACAAAASPAAGQPISIDQGVRAAGLWCFPITTDPLQYVYVPSEVQLVRDDTGKPQVSFVRYVINSAPESGPQATITGSAGGGVLHFLVQLETPPALVAEAQQALRRALNNDDVVLRGPLVFQDGRYSLVSSVLNPAGGPPGRKVFTSGRAPVLEGNRLAFSFDLAPREASLLMQSFAMTTPDVSLVFDMQVAGLTNAYDAELLIDWAEVRNSRTFGAGASVYFVSADVEVAFDELRRTNAIRLRSSGSDSAMEGLLNTVYAKLLELLFRPVEPDRIPPDRRGGLADALNALLDPQGPVGSRKLTGFGLNVAYQLKELKSSGTSVLTFNHRSLVERHSFLTFNIGDFHRRYGSDPGYFRAVNLDDPTFQQRDIVVAIDGALAPEFERYINSVTVTLRKVHQNGQETVREVVIDRRTIAGTAPLRMTYGWKGDEDRVAWLQYETRTQWSFKGGGAYRTDWERHDRPMIDLFAPYERRAIQIVGSPAALQRLGVRAVVVELQYGFFGEQRRHQLVVRPDQPPGDQIVQVTLPLGDLQYRYTITWQLDGGRRLTTAGSDSSGVVFADELPGKEIQQ